MNSDFPIKTLMIIVLLLLFVGLASTQRRVPAAGIRNLLRPMEELQLSVRISEGEREVYSRNFSVLYSNQQPEITDQILIDTRQLSQNLSLTATLYRTDPDFLLLSTQSRNLTRFQKIRKQEDNMPHGGYDLIDQLPKDKQEEEPPTYALHIAKDFNVIVLVSDMVFEHRKQILPQMELKLYQDESGLRYSTGVDISQFHIPFRDYAVATDQHNVTLHIFPYELLHYMFFYSIGHPEAMAAGAGLLGELMGTMIDDSAMDEMKEILFSNHIFLLIAYFSLSGIQTVLKLFTLKQQYQFWKNIGENKGMSLKTLFFELAAETIVTLYLIQHDSTKLVIAFCLLDIAVVLWKINRAFKVTLKASFPFLSIVPSQSYSSRANVDSQAIWYMNYLLVPLSILYFGWSLHSRGWVVRSVYTFLLENAVAFIAIFGFIMMTPQLYINYQLKSVEHLNWRGLIYRFINTILDDLFAFMVTIPTLRRLMYFRDDIIFLIYIYQRHIYKVDYSRKTVETAHLKET